MNLFSIRFIAGFAEVLTAALFHFLWQGAVITLVLLLIVKLLDVRAARRRYLLSVGMLLTMGMAPLLTSVLIHTGSLHHTNKLGSRSSSVDVLEHASRVVEEQLPFGTAAQPVADLKQDSVDAGNLRVDVIVLIAWLAGVSFFSARLAIGFGVTVWIRAKVKPLSDPLEQRVRILGNRLKIEARNRVLICERVGQAVALGFIRPVVLIPASWLTQLTPEVLEAVIAHELAHIRRWDLWVNLMQRLIETVLFYHPAVWWLSRRIRLEREMCCDEIAADCLDRAVYARSLESVARMAQGNLLMAASINGGKTMNLLSRVRYLLGSGPAHAEGHWSAIAVGFMILPVATVAALSWYSGPLSSVAMADDHLTESKAIGKMELLGGTVTRDEMLPGHPVIEIDLRGSKRFNDKYVQLLKDFKSLKSLNLDRTSITNDSLKEVSKLTNLREIRLHGTRITDEHVQDLKKSLPSTIVVYESADESNAIALIEPLGGQVERDHTLLGGPVIGVKFELQDQLNDQLRDGDLHLLKAFPLLTSLNLNHTGVTDEGLKELSTLKSLTTLKLDGTSITDERFKSINELTGLTSLSLFATKVTGSGLNDLSGLKNLRTLNLRRTNITDEHLRGLRNLVGLTTLSLQETQISDEGMEELTKLTALTTLNLQNNILAGLITDVGLRNIRNLANLKSLNLYGCQISDHGLKEISHLTNLTTLFVDSPQITDAGMREIRNLPNLTYLDANRVSITNAGLKEIGEMQGLTFVDLCYTRITDDGLKNLRGLKQLERLLLSESNISGVGLKELTDLERLTRLAANKINDDGMKEIGKLKKLKLLNLSEAPITDDGLKQLRQLESLTTLYLNDTGITDAGLREISNFKSLTELGLTGTKVTNAGVAELANALPSLKIHR